MKLVQNFFNPPKILKKDYLNYERNKLKLKYELECNNFGFQKELNQPRTEEIEAIVKKLKRFKTVLFLGTGGSSLGGRTLVSIIESIKKLNPKIYFLENVDFESIVKALENIDLKKTGVVTISKSGETIETISQLFYITNKFDEKNIPKKKNIFIITENKKSFLKNLQESEKYSFLEHSSEIGGRFSIFSVTGLVPAKLSGFNVEIFCSSARKFLTEIMGNNELFDYYFKSSFYQFILSKTGRNISILMPYSDSLRNFSLWFRQLLAESIGKNGKGFTPVSALGTIDQHSQLQLYLDGPKDKIFTIISRKLKNQNHTKLDCRFKNGKYSLLHQKSLEELFYAEMKATCETIKKNGLPVRVLELNSIDEESVGKLSIFYIIETIFLCQFLKVNPFDQPAVEEGKLLTKSYLK